MDGWRDPLQALEAYETWLVLFARMFLTGRTAVSGARHDLRQPLELPPRVEPVDRVPFVG
jgi:hypothetical protein